MHSPIGGSSAHIWGRCAKYVTMAAAVPETESSQEARDGIAAHEIGAELIRKAAVGQFPTWADFDGQAATDGTLFTEEMFDAAKLYADDVGAVMRSTGVFTPRVEELLPVPRIHPAAFGSSDVTLFHKGGNKLYAWDFKFGHRHVEAFENLQGVYYLAGELDRMGVNGYDDQFLEIEFRIVQPRAYRREGPVLSWKGKAVDLRAHVNILNRMAAAQFLPDQKATTGPHCGDCPGRVVCPAALRAGNKLYEVAVQAVPDELEPAALGLQLSLIKRAKQQLTDLETVYEERVESTVRGGGNVPGWATEPTYGRLAWIGKPEDVIAALGAEVSKPGVMTPTQAKNKGLDSAVVEALSERPARGIKVVPDDGTKTKRIFTNG